MPDVRRRKPLKFLYVLGGCLIIGFHNRKLYFIILLQVLPFLVLRRHTNGTRAAASKLGEFAKVWN